MKKARCAAPRRARAKKKTVKYTKTISKQKHRNVKHRPQLVFSDPFHSAEAESRLRLGIFCYTVFFTQCHVIAHVRITFCRWKEIVSILQKTREQNICASDFHPSQTRKTRTQSGRRSRPLLVPLFRALDGWNSLAHSFSPGF